MITLFYHVFEHYKHNNSICWFLVNNFLTEQHRWKYFNVRKIKHDRAI